MGQPFALLKHHQTHAQHSSLLSGYTDGFKKCHSVRVSDKTSWARCTKETYLHHMGTMHRGLLVIAAFCMVTVLSCKSYQWEEHTDADGRKFRSKVYKDPMREDREHIRGLFEDTSHSVVSWRYSGPISCDTVHGYTYVQFDSVRVYLFGESGNFKSIFTSGILCGQMFYEPGSFRKSRLSTKNDQLSWLSDTTATTDIWGWTGYSVFIGSFKLLKHVGEKPTQRRFSFSPATYSSRFPAIDVNSVFLLELTNESAEKKTDLETFIKGAHLTVLKFGWIEV